MTKERPLILITNDDGIRAPGLETLARQLAQAGEVMVVAPSQERSAVGHGISLTVPLRVEEHGEGRWAVSGTPADSVVIALHALCPRQPALVVSGINAGLNLGTDVFYSGTVAGALEGAIRGVPAIAVSQDPPWRDGDSLPSEEALNERTAQFCLEVARRVLERPLPPRSILNVNAPANLTTRAVWTRQGPRIYREQVECRLDPRKRPYYWIGGPPVLGQDPPGTDGHAVDSGIISVSLLGLDLSYAPAGCYHGLKGLAGFQLRTADAGGEDHAMEPGDR